MQGHLLGTQGGEILNAETTEKLVPAEESDDGFWRDADGKPLSVSASDLERHAYCLCLGL